MDILSTLGNAIKSFLEAVEHYAWVLFLISGFLLFAPSIILNTVNLDNLSDDLKRIAGLVFITALALIITRWVKLKIEYVKQNINKETEIKDSISFQLKNLNYEEKKIIKDALEKDQQTCYGSIDDSSLGSLVYRGFMCRGARSASTLDQKPRTPYTFYDDVWKILKKNKLEN